MYRLTTHNLRRYTANSLDYVSKRREPSDESGYFGSGKQTTLDADFLVADIKEAGRLFVHQILGCCARIYSAHTSWMLCNERGEPTASCR
jgi:hypothetical protein